MSATLTSWALPRIGRLLPLDDESLKEVIVYSESLSKEAGAVHLQNILGDSPQALDFISSFNARRREVEITQKTLVDPGVPRQSTQTRKKSKPPLHSTGPARRPEGYGDVTGGYQKASGDCDYTTSVSKKNPSATTLSDSLSFSQQPGPLQLPRVTHSPLAQSSSSSRDASPRSGRLPSSAAGTLMSDMPNVKAKQAKRSSHQVSGSSTPQYKMTTTSTSSINDLTSTIAALQLSTTPSPSGERRKCPCNASVHPLFITAPNCLNCGKIICALEGLQPCSFCDNPILTKDQVASMIRALKEERGQERMATHNAAGSMRGTPTLGGTTPESGHSGDESSEASRARAHRDKLLGFQKNNAQRTQVHDEAADYDVTLTPGTTQWMNPVQRAAALKKQQQYIRETEEAAKPEYEKKQTVMSMSIKNGKLVKTVQKINASSTPASEDEDLLAEKSSHQPGGESSKTTGGGGAFSNNPLLASGKLVRPVWKAPDGDEGKGKAREERPRKSVWRRVQDDNDDNEQWILDGGTRGFGDKSVEGGD